MSWQHYINDREVSPFDTRKAEISEEIEGLRKRIKPPKSIILKYSDYRYMKTLETNNITDTHTYEIKENGVRKAFGEFLIYDCEFNTTYQTCKVNVQAKDDYTYINENEDIEVNILDISELETARIKGDLHSWYEIALVRVGQYYVPDIIDTDWKVMYYSHPVDLGSFRDYNAIVYFTEKIVVDDKTSMSGWTEVSRNDRLIEYRRSPAVGSEPFADSDVIGLDTFYDFYYWNEIGYGIILCKEKPGAPDFNTYKNDDDWLIVDEGVIELYDYEASDRASSSLVLREVEYIIAVRKTVYNGKLTTDLTQSYKGYSLKACMNKILTDAMPSFEGEIKSTFLFNDENAPGEPELQDAPGYAESTTDYVAGILRRDKYLISKDDFIRPNTSELATINYATFKQVADYYEKFQVSWHIDSVGNLRFEHKKYYETREIGSDLSGLDIPQEYKYKSNEIPNRIIFDEQETGSEDFTQKQILHGEIPAIDGTRENREEKSYSFFSVDIDWMNTHINEISDEGFVFVETELVSREIFTIPVTYRRILQINGKASGETIQNVGLSLANVLFYYWRHDCYKPTFELYGFPDLDETEIQAESLKKLKYHEISFSFVNNIETLKFVNTFLGTGEYVNLKYPPVEGKTYKAEIRYE